MTPRNRIAQIVDETTSLAGLCDDTDLDTLTQAIQMYIENELDAHFDAQGLAERLFADAVPNAGADRTNIEVEALAKRSILLARIFRHQFKSFIR